MKNIAPFSMSLRIDSLLIYNPQFEVSLKQSLESCCEVICRLEKSQNDDKLVELLHKYGLNKLASFFFEFILNTE
jgi:hypothetical protein